MIRPPITPLPEHAISAYRQEQPSIARLILEAQWAYHQRSAALELAPDSPKTLGHIRAMYLHTGALLDVLALRDPDDDEARSATHDRAMQLCFLDQADLSDPDRTPTDYLRTQYSRLHRHPMTTLGGEPGYEGTHDGTGHAALLSLSVPYLVRETLDSYHWSQTIGPAWPGNDAATRRAETRRYLLHRGLLLDLAAARAPEDGATAVAAAAAGNALRLHDGRTEVSAAAALDYLENEYFYLSEDETDAQHPADCLGGCGGSAIVMTIMTWDDQGDGIFVPVHQEPAECLAGVPHQHPEGCADCGGHGFTYSRGERHRCFGLDIPSLDYDDEAPF
ncbi:hypothetical protein OG689_44390 [Kitasatospora sp. NBC_00240]|uniref:hypothetical protein n=1 Tax=Kitasatospora sp. NBC_00240 TaxID=2903567 RepID=UPI002258E900|nr:hypothetical protein [Kitasatospora sp. NBC_00240]MCX5216178.1 hypothetical protein [Kitasatospora sp. NBC_00240]